MQHPYFVSSTSHQHQQHQPVQNPPHYPHHVSYDLPPVQSVTSPSFQYPPAISAPPNPSTATPTTTTNTTPSSSTTSTASNGLPMAHLLQPVSPQHAPLSAAPPYPRSYTSSSGSPAEPTAVLPEPSAAAGSMSGTSGFSLGQAGQQSQSQQQQAGAGSAAAAAAGLHQKRAYRQRRKDPSCDACRERKVKCDASESSSCTECNNRKVRCQFTKETNRRMSSIKQVQDLEKQLLSTKQQLQQLRSGALKPESSWMELDWIDTTSATTGQPGFKLPDIGSRPSRRPPTGQGGPGEGEGHHHHHHHHLSSIRTNLRTYSQGIWKPPSAHRQSNVPCLGVDAPPLPAKPVADDLLSQYHAYVHSSLPVVRWPDFLAEYEQVFRTRRSLQGVPRDWTAVLFAVLACGALHHHHHHHHRDYDGRDEAQGPGRKYDGHELLRIACNVIDLGQDDFSIDRVRASFLISVFLYETNAKSACWVWIGAAVRLAQELGLHLESASASSDSESRKRVWWAVYTWDRLLALETGKPALINDDDCEVDLPSAVDDERFADSDNSTPAIVDGQQLTSPFLATTQVVRSLGHLSRTLRQTPTVTASTLDSFDRHFDTCLGVFPPTYHPKTDLPLDPRFLSPVIHLQNARLLLHRHNLSPLSPIEARSAAFDACLSITLDTAGLLSGSMQTEDAFASAATTLLCTHIWRCSLLLLFRQQYAAALACVHASAIIADRRSVNAACGRYLAFFLRCLLDRLCSRPGPGQSGRPAVDLSRDEELVAYVVGDLHDSFDGWVWSSDVSSLEAISPGPGPGPGPIPSPPGLSESTQGIDWEGWEWVERTVQHLLAEQQQQQQRPDGTHELARPNESTFLSPAATEAEDTRRSSSHSRMTIASII